MGYCNEVAIGIGFTSAEEITAFLVAARLGGEISPDTIEEYEVTQVSEGVFILHTYYECVGWDDSYDDVGNHHKFLDMATERNYATAFIRIGEIFDDVEVRIDDGECLISMWDFFGVNRSIGCPKGGTLVGDFLNKPKE